MVALTQGRLTPRRAGDQIAHPMGTGKTCYAGGLVALLTTGGFATPAGTALSGNAVGVAEETVVNPGANGALNVTVLRGVFRFGNSADADLMLAPRSGRPVTSSTIRPWPRPTAVRPAASRASSSM